MKITYRKQQQQFLLRVFKCIFRILLLCIRCTRNIEIDLTKLNNQQRIVISIVNLMKLKLISGLHQQIKRECSTHIISNKMNKQSLIHI